MMDVSRDADLRRALIEWYLRSLFYSDKLDKEAIKRYLADNNSVQFALGVILKLKYIEKINTEKAGEYKKLADYILSNA
jgi:hypothetical protein